MIEEINTAFAKANPEEYKKIYYMLCKKHHPDVGGDAEVFKYLQHFYKALHSEYSSRVRVEAREEWESSLYSEIIEKLATLPVSLEIEIVGTWLWVSGETKPIKETLKQMGFWWCAKHKAWYIKKDFRKKVLVTNLTMDQIRNQYGSQKVKTKTKTLITQ